MEVYKPDTNNVGYKIVKIDLSEKFQLNDTILVQIKKGKFGLTVQFLHEDKIFFLGMRGILFSCMKILNCQYLESYVGKRLNIKGTLVNYGKRSKNGVTFYDIRFYPTSTSST
ncbi:MAG: hypothetical protein QW156_03995 [Candidatus Aenigmatarchaeota archaeon]